MCNKLKVLEFEFYYKTRAWKSDLQYMEKSRTMDPSLK